MTYSPHTVEGLDLDLHEALSAAIDAARKAGRIIWESVQQRRAAVASAYAPTSLPRRQDGDKDKEAEHGIASMDDSQKARAAAMAVSDHLRVETKTSPNDLVTVYDKRCDAVITKVLEQYVDRVNQMHQRTSSTLSPSTKALDSNATGDGEHDARPYPFRFITEELNPDGALTDDLTWIVDPIDGTMSFVHGLPDCCVSIGLTYRKECILAVVFCPFLAGGAVGVMQSTHAREALGHPTVNPGPYHINAPGHHGNTTPPPPPQQPSQVPASAASGGNKRTIPQPPRTLSPSSSQTAHLASGGGGRDEAGVVECIGELYVALKGRGVFVNGIPARVNAAATRQTAMAVLNFPHSVNLSRGEAASAAEDAALGGGGIRTRTDCAIDAVGNVRREMSIDMMPGVRAYGSCVTTLALISAGHVDLYVEPAGKIWDVVCGSLLVKEAGGCVKNFLGEELDLARDTTIAAGATEELVDYATALCVKHELRQFWLC